jgi:glycogen operon protein
MGDEVARTQHGNNNAYCQDNEISWFDWSQIEKNRDQLRFFQRMIRFRRDNAVLHQPRFFDGSKNERGIADITWHGTRLNEPSWNDPEVRCLAFTLGGMDGGADIHVMMNMHWTPQSFELPPITGRQWYRLIDTYRDSPDDITDPGAEPLVKETSYRVGERSIVVLVSK